MLTKALRHTQRLDEEFPGQDEVDAEVLKRTLRDAINEGPGLLRWHGLVSIHQLGRG